MERSFFRLALESLTGLVYGATHYLSITSTACGGLQLAACALAIRHASSSSSKGLPVNLLLFSSTHIG